MPQRRNSILEQVPTEIRHGIISAVFEDYFLVINLTKAEPLKNLPGCIDNSSQYADMKVRFCKAIKGAFSLAMMSQSMTEDVLYIISKAALPFRHARDQWLKLVQRTSPRYTVISTFHRALALAYFKIFKLSNALSRLQSMRWTRCKSSGSQTSQDTALDRSLLHKDKILRPTTYYMTLWGPRSRSSSPGQTLEPISAPGS